MDARVYAVTHKYVDEIGKDRILIGVGPNKDIKNVAFYDDTKDNIADKNASFCELTALYWIWKNVKCDYVGLEHYRRYFADDKIFSSKPMKIKKMLKLLENSDIILPRLFISEETVKEYYEKYHIIKDLEICGDIIKEKYPEYLDCFNAVNNSHECYSMNMFFAKKELADEYCSWIFDILFEAERRIDITDRDVYQTRVFGFLSERLFNVWIMKKNLKVSPLMIHGYNVGGKFSRKIKAGIDRFQKIFRLKK